MKIIPKYYQKLFERGMVTFVKERIRRGDDVRWWITICRCGNKLFRYWPRNTITCQCGFEWPGVAVDPPNARPKDQS